MNNKVPMSKDFYVSPLLQVFNCSSIISKWSDVHVLIDHELHSYLYDCKNFIILVVLWYGAVVVVVVSVAVSVEKINKNDTSFENNISQNDLLTSRITISSI